MTISNENALAVDCLVMIDSLLLNLGTQKTNARFFNVFLGMHTFNCKKIKRQELFQSHCVQHTEPSSHGYQAQVTNVLNLDNGQRPFYQP
jgi:hypothetical protein